MEKKASEKIKTFKKKTKEQTLVKLILLEVED